MLLVTYQLKIDNPSNQSCFSLFLHDVVYLPSTLSPLVESRFFFKGAPQKQRHLILDVNSKQHLMDVVSFDVCQCVVLKSENRNIFIEDVVLGGITSSGLLFFEVTVCFAQQVFTSLFGLLKHGSLIHALHIYLHVFMHSISLSQSGWTREAAWKTMLTRKLVYLTSTPNFLLDLDLTVILGWNILILAHLAYH